MLEHLPGLHEHGCSYKEPGGFVRRLREDEGTWLGHVMEHVAIELQVVAGSDVTFGRTRSIDGRPVSTTWCSSSRMLRLDDRPASWRWNSLAACCPTNSNSMAPRTRLGLCVRARPLHSLRAAQGIRAEYCIACAGRRRTRHPVAAVEPLQPGPVRARPLPAAHPGDDDRPHQQYRGRAGLR